MKKFTKICLITAFILILIGGTICVLGEISGGWRLVNEMDMDDSFFRRFASVLEDTYVGDRAEELRIEAREEIYEAEEEANEELEELEELEDAWDDMEDEISDDVRGDIEEELLAEISGEREDTGIGASQVKNMKIDIGGAALCFMESESDNFEIIINGKRKYRYYESQGKFCLEGGKNNTIGNNNERVYLYIPSGKSFDEVEINVGGGLISIEELEAKKVELTVGAGIIFSDGISCHDLEVEVGAGKAALEGIEADRMDIEVGMGSAYVQGGITSKIDVECGMGSIVMELDNAETDFNYEIECSAGSIVVGGETYQAFLDELHVNNRASGKCSLECSMGRIEMTFAR